jgi:hypothetical protein
MDGDSMDSVVIDDMVKTKISLAIDSGLYNPNKFPSCLADLRQTSESRLINTISFQKSNLQESTPHPINPPKPPKLQYVPPDLPTQTYTSEDLDYENLRMVF